jgi:hypothetical protein
LHTGILKRTEDEDTCEEDKESSVLDGRKIKNEKWRPETEVTTLHTLILKDSADGV